MYKEHSHNQEFPILNHSPSQIVLCLFTTNIQRNDALSICASMICGYFGESLVFFHYDLIIHNQQQKLDIFLF